MWDRRILSEPLVREEEYAIRWREPKLGLGELAKLRWIEGLSRRRLARRFGRTQSCIQRYYDEMKRLGHRVPGLTAEERRRRFKMPGNSDTF